MSRFDNFSKNNFARPEQMKQLKQLKRQEIKKIEPDKQERNVTPQQAQAQEASAAAQTTHQSAEASALDALANQNLGLINVVNGISNKEHFRINEKSNLINTKEVHMADDIPGSSGNTGGTTGTTPTDPTTTETTISNEELYANREKYSQEVIDSLNIGIESGKFKSIVSQYFDKVTINSEEVYILKSGTLTQVKDLISQIYAADKLYSAPDYIPNQPEDANGYALLSSSTYEQRKASYYYMCYLNGIPYDGHEFENGNFNKEIALACGLYECEDVFANFMNNENVQRYLQNNFGITVSVPPSQEHIDLWNKLAKLAAIGENGENTGEYNKYNVIKYFGLALTDPQFMSFVDKASFEKEENSVLNNSWDIETVKNVISKRYPELLENSEVLTDEFLEWIGSNAYVFLLTNQNKLRANGLQDFVNYGNIPSWITFNSGTEFNEELLLKCCIQSMAKLAEIGSKLGYEPKEFVNRELANCVTEMYSSAVTNPEGAGGPAGAPRMAQGNQEVPDYVMNILWSKFGPVDITKEYDEFGDCRFYIDGKYVARMDFEFNDLWYEDDYTSNGPFSSIWGYSFKNGEIIPNKYFNSEVFFALYYSDSKLPPEQREFFTNGIDDLYQYIKDNTDFESLCSIIGFLMSPTLVGYGETQDIDYDKLNLYADLYSEIFEGENNDIYQYLYNTLSNNLQANGFTDLLRMMPASSDNVTDISALFYWAGNRLSADVDDFDFNADGILLNADAGQGQTGDCWYVATNIAMAQHPELLQLIKNHCVEIDEVNETYTVTLGGEKYTYTFEEIRKAKELSRGDVELRVFEMAAREALGPGADDAIATGGWLGYAVELFAGDEFDFGVNEYSYIDESNISEILEHIKSGTYISYLGIGNERYWAININTGEKVELAGNHAYAVVGGDDNYIYIVNPWDSSKTLRLSIETIKNNPYGFDYSDISVDDFSRAIQNANNIVPYGIQTNLESGAYFDSNGNFDWNQYYEDCKGYGMNPANLDLMFEKTSEGSRLSIFNPDGTVTIVLKPTSGQMQIIEIGRLTASFMGPDGVPFDIDNFTDEQLIEELHKSLDDISLFIMEDGKIDRDLLSSMLPKFTVGGWFDSSALMILMQYYKKDDGSVDSEGFKNLLSNFTSYDDVERFARSVLLYEKVQAAMMHNNAQAAIYALQSWAEERIAKLKSSGSIYNEMSYWDWADVMSNPYASTEDYISALNAMNSIINAAKSIGVSLDAYISMSPTERARRQGMLTTPMNLDYILPIYFNLDGESNTYTISNQSSCINPPDWFIEYYLSGEMPTADMIDTDIISDSHPEAEDNLYLARQHYQFWQLKNSSMLEGFSPIEQYNIYQSDMMYFMMWLNTDAIVEGYSKDDMWEDLYAAYHESGAGMI